MARIDFQHAAILVAEIFREMLLGCYEPRPFHNPCKAIVFPFFILDLSSIF